MSLSALRHFQNGAPVAPFSPQIKEELVKAQLDTIGPSVWAKFIEWQAKPTKPHTFGAHTIGVSTKGEWPKVKSAIARGAPIVLGLIRVQADNLGGLDPVEAVQHVGSNHQVLAIGYDYHQLTQDTIIWVYDPNSPNSLSKISMNLGLPENQIKAEQRTYWSATKTLQTRPDNVRGFFVIGDSSTAERAGRPTNSCAAGRLPGTRGLDAEQGYRQGHDEIGEDGHEGRKEQEPAISEARPFPASL